MNMPLATPPSLSLSEEEKILFPDPDELINIGHALHGADDPNLAGTYSQEVSRLIVNNFLTIETIPGTVGHAYKAAGLQIVRGYGRALRRERDIQTDKNLAAEKIKDRQEKHIAKNWESEGFGAIAKYLWPLFLGLIGLLVAWIVGSTVSESVAEKTGTDIPTAAAVIGALIIGRILSKWWRKRVEDRIYQSYEVRRRLAKEAYETAKLREQKFWRTRAVEAWKQYTGEDFPESASYAIVMEGDLVEDRKHNQMIFQHDKTDIERLQEIVRWVIDACKKQLRRKRKEAS